MSTPDVSTFKQWTAAQFGSYMKTKGLGAYYEAIVQHDITGETAPRLSENDLKVRGNKQAHKQTDKIVPGRGLS